MREEAQVITLTRGNVNNNYMPLTGVLNFFPSASVGGNNRAVSGKKFVIEFDGVDGEFETDIDGAKNIFRIREPIKQFYSLNGFTGGEHVFIYKVNDWRYRISTIDPTSSGTAGSARGGSKGPARRILQESIRIIRDTAESRKVKALYEMKCQVCGLGVNTADGLYVEAAHVWPLGEDGPDDKSNILSLCPNHHAMLDKGGMTINDDMTLNGEVGKLQFVAGHHLNLDCARFQRKKFS